MSETRNRALRCHATFLFADVCDYTALNELCDPEEVATLLFRVRDEVERVVRRRGGVVNEWRGDGVLCTFGLPRASEEDARHAIEAALEMHAVMLDLSKVLSVPGFEIRLHSGIDSGLVFAREREGGGGYDLIGDAVNTAARLCARAGRDEVWASDACLGVFKELFVTESHEPLTLKGKAAKVSACRIVSRSQALTRFAASERRGLTPLVGREPALATLERSLSRARRGGLAQVSVIGGPGMGKTRLLEEFKRRVPPGVRVFGGACEDTPNATPLEPFVNVLRQALELPKEVFGEGSENPSLAIERLAPELQRHEAALLHLLGLRLLPSEQTDLGFVQLAFVNAVVAVLDAVCARGPLGLVLDDWQWADDASRQALGSILRSLRSARLLVVVASRELGDPLLSGDTVLELQPFSLEESAKVISYLLAYALEPGLSKNIHEQAGGSPLFLEELCRAFPESIERGSEGLIASKIPATLRDIVRVRVERLPPTARHVLEVIAVAGREVPRWLLRELTGLSALEMERAVALLRERDLVHCEDGAELLSFKHGTTRDVVYDVVRLPERRRLHRALALALESQARSAGRPEPFETLGFHYARAGDHARAAHYAELAGDRALRAASLDRARQHYRAALDALERLEPSADIERRWVAIAAKWSSASLYSPVEEHLALIAKSCERALRLEDLPAVAQAEAWLGWFCYALGKQEQASQYLRDALERVEGFGNQRLKNQLLLSLAQCRAAAGDYPRALELFAQGVDGKLRSIARSEKMSGRRPIGYAFALACKGMVHGDIGEFETAYDCLDEALELLSGSGHAVEGSCLAILGILQLFQGCFEQCLETAARARATAERVNGRYVFAMSTSCGSYARWMLTRDRRALDEFRRAVGWLESSGVQLYLSFSYAYLGEALVSAGEHGMGREYAKRALARASLGDPIGEIVACRTLGRLALTESSDREEAVRYVRRAFAAAEARGSKRERALTELMLFDLGPALDANFGPVATEPLRKELKAMGMAFYERRIRGLTQSGVMPSPERSRTFEKSSFNTSR